MNKIFKIFLGLISAGFVLLSCTKQDHHYRQFVEGGELTYPARVDSVKLFSGNQRMKISYQITSDPKVTKTKVFWNNLRDSFEIPITRSAGIDTINVLIPQMPEGSYTFSLFNYDKDGRRSIKVEAIGTVYGDTYIKSLFNRPLKSVKFVTNKAVLEWYGASAQSVGVEVKYKDASGVDKTLLVPNDAVTYDLPNFKKGDSFSYRTLNLPQPTAIDTFYTAYEVKQVL